MPAAKVVWTWRGMRFRPVVRAPRARSFWSTLSTERRDSITA
jgi:hypothetical protein